MGRVFYDKQKVLNAAKRLGCTEQQFNSISSLDTYVDSAYREMVLRLDVHDILETTLKPYQIRLLQYEPIAYYRTQDDVILKSDSESVGMN